MQINNIDELIKSNTCIFCKSKLFCRNLTIINNYAMLKAQSKKDDYLFKINKQSNKLEVDISSISVSDKRYNSDFIKEDILSLKFVCPKQIKPSSKFAVGYSEYSKKIELKIDFKKLIISNILVKRSDFYWQEDIIYHCVIQDDELIEINTLNDKLRLDGNKISLKDLNVKIENPTEELLKNKIKKIILLK